MSGIETESATADRRRIKQMEVMVAEAVTETADTTTLVLFTGNDRLDYKAGHFLTIDPHQFEGLERFIAFLEDLKGKREPPRAYSMASSPHEKYLAVTVKEERYTSGLTQYPPLLSPLLVKRLVRGTRLVVTGFTGPYTLPEDIESRTDHLVHVCAGSGSVPNFAILKFALEFHPRLRHTFVYSNRTWDDVIFGRELTALAHRHRDRVRVIHTLTREPEPHRHGPDVRAGRVGIDVLKDAIPDPSACRVFACGPAITVWDRKAARESGVTPAPRFLETVLECLMSIGVRSDQITRESYG
jgi:3-ketosteroid 9alpha-monooxygenase subunit B